MPRANKAKLLSDAIYRETNREALKERQMKWRADNPERWKAIKAEADLRYKIRLGGRPNTRKPKILRPDPLEEKMTAYFTAKGWD